MFLYFTTGDIWSLAHRWITQCKYCQSFRLFKIVKGDLYERSPGYCDILYNYTGDLV